MVKKLVALTLLTLLGPGEAPLLLAQTLPEEAVPAPVETEVSDTSHISTSTPEVPLPAPVEPVPVLPEETTELIVKFHEDAADLNFSRGRAEAQSAVAGADGIIVEHLADANSAVVEVSEAEVAEAIAILSQDASVAYAEPNYPRSFGAVIVDDASFASQWALQNTGQTVNGTTGTADADIDAPDAWDISLGTSTLVAVIDNGVLYNHPDLVNRMWDGTACVSDTGAPLGSCMHGYDFDDDDLDPTPQATSTTDTYHGTHVAGIIAAEANNGIGIAGVAPEARIMALRFGLDVASEVRAIDFAIQNGAKVINASFGGAQYSQAEYDAIARFRDAGGIFIASAGNGGQDQVGDDNDVTPTYPASYNLANIISVAATGQSDELAPFSNFGVQSVDLGAPGRRIVSTIATNGITADYGYLSGTSMAAPQVAGTLALLMARYPNASTTAYRTALLEGGDTVLSLATTTTGKRLNAHGALLRMADDLTPPVITLIGNATISLTVGDTYTEAGATALDETDGSVAVTIGGDTVDTNTAGTYTVTYDAVDQAGNHASQVTRTVTVSAPEPPPRRRSGGGGGGGGGSRQTTTSNPSRELHTNAPVSSYASLTPEQRMALLQTLLQLLVKLQAQLAQLQAQGR